MELRDLFVLVEESDRICCLRCTTKLSLGLVTSNSRHLDDSRPALPKLLSVFGRTLVT